MYFQRRKNKTTKFSRMNFIPRQFIHKSFYCKKMEYMHNNFAGRQNAGEGVIIQSIKGKDI